MTGAKSWWTSPARHFIQHLLEMTAAMFIGMGVLAMPARLLWEALGWDFMIENLVARTLVMATNMTIGMVLWMRFRGHRWLPIAEMSLAMYLPFVLMYPFYFGGMVGTTGVMVVGHVLMVPAMAVVMLFRVDEYTVDHSRHRRRGRDEPAVKELAVQPEG
ncbi:hypothetical protein [Actinophytocola glycyrrhizae]|uniref:Flagellar biosynthetic protein FliP n=1 Tax=Actinophytocola glycyrrhizae TaxID=2044873 RepID=A0ABV9S7E0_9PSEU